MRICLSCTTRFQAEGWTCPACGYHPPENGVPRFCDPLEAVDQSVDRGLFERLAAVEPDSFWFVARNRLLIWALQSYFPAAASLLEVGCGAGFVLQGFQQARPDLRLVGGDPFPPALDVARHRVPGAELLQLDGQMVPFDAEFDVVCAFDVLEHVDDDAAMLAQMVRAVRPAGGVMITVPQHRWLWGVADDFALHRRRYTRPGLLGRMARAGLEHVWATSFVSLLVPAMALARLRPHPLSAYDPVHELRPGRTLNRVLEGVLRVEQAIIERGRSLPVGGSLVAIARRPDG